MRIGACVFLILLSIGIYGCPTTDPPATDPPMVVTTPEGLFGPLAPPEMVVSTPAGMFAPDAGQSPPPPPNSAPNAVASADPLFTVDDDGNGNEMIRLDGTQSSDPDGSITSYRWMEGSTRIAIGARPTIPLTVGLHTITLEVTDDGGAKATANVIVHVAAMSQRNP